MSLPLVEARNLSKSYRLWTQPSDRLTSALFAQAAAVTGLPKSWRDRLRAAADRRAKEFHALSDVSFELRQGESLGIIGRNGSGKSTLLQILAGTLQPTSGQTIVRGRTAALLELGSGFNLEFSGRENVLLQAALFGVSRREALDRFEQVAAFANIGEFIEQPVKVYSSGMMIRLAFATQTVLNPDLFIVDEALSVGDVFFQARCAKFFEEKLKAGMSLILVSHDLTSVKALCHRTIVMHEGRVAFFGPSDQAVTFYHQLHRARIASTPRLSGSAEISGSAGTVKLPPGAVERNWDSPQEAGTREAELVHCRVRDNSGIDRNTFDYGEKVHVEAYVRAAAPVEEITMCLELSNRHGQVIHGVSSRHLGQRGFTLEQGRLYRFTFTLTAQTGPGTHLIDLAVGWGDRGDGAPAQLVHRVAHVATLTVIHPTERARFFGWADLGTQLTLE